MNKTKDKTPKQDGFYWYYMSVKRHEPSAVMIRGGRGTMFGVGSCPLEMVYNPKVLPDAVFESIPLPKAWDNVKIEHSSTYALVKHPNGYIGFGCLRPGWHNNFGGTIAWLDNPNCGLHCGFWLPYNDGYQFKILKRPNK